MNIDFAHHAGFSTYVLLLIFSGVVMLVMASPAVRTERRMLRVLNAAFGLGFVGYGFYLAFVFQGGSYVIFFKAFILPVLMIIRTVRSAKTRCAATIAPMSMTYPASANLRAPNPYTQSAPSLYAEPQPGYAPARHAAPQASAPFAPDGYVPNPSPAAQQPSPQTD